MKTLITLTLTLLLAVVASPSVSRAAEPAKDKFVVHEWGVAFVGRAGGDVVLGPAKERVDGLPPFVLRHDRAYTPKRQDLGWDKPVIHLYGPDGLDVSLEVTTPQGAPVAYWPAPAVIERVGKPVADRKAMMVYTLSEAAGLRWGGTLSKAATGELAPAAEGHWWSRLREAVPGAYFNAAGGASERFVFYEATARQKPVISAVVTSDGITIRNAHDKPVGPVVVFANDGVSVYGARVRSVPAKDEVWLGRASNTEKWWEPKEMVAVYEEQWRAAGMTEAEARAIVGVWREELIDRPGFMLVSRMPPELYEQMLPLKVTPEPAERVRVGMVFDTLEGQPERAKWLGSLDDTVAKWVKQLRGEDFRQRQAAVRKLAGLGDLADPYLEALSNDPDPEVAKAAQSLLRAGSPPSASPAPAPAGPRP